MLTAIRASMPLRPLEYPLNDGDTLLFPVT